MLAACPVVVAALDHRIFSGTPAGVEAPEDESLSQPRAELASNFWKLFWSRSLIVPFALFQLSLEFIPLLAGHIQIEHQIFDVQTELGQGFLDQD